MDYNLFLEIVIWVIKAVAGVPIVLYPFMLLANVMSIAGHREKEAKPLTKQQIIFKYFIYYNLCYPVFYGLSYWFMNYTIETKQYEKGILVGLVPPLILLALFRGSMKK